MIKITDCKENIINCWQEAFGDSSEDILFFINNVREADCLGYYVGDELASMLYLVESSLGKYVYAACTLKKYRGLGYMRELLNFCKDKFSRICLIPANEGLIDYYKKCGLVIAKNLNELTFNQTQEINEYLFDGCELKEPFVMVYERNV